MVVVVITINICIRRSTATNKDMVVLLDPIMEATGIKNLMPSQSSCLIFSPLCLESQWIQVLEIWVAIGDTITIQEWWVLAHLSWWIIISLALNTIHIWETNMVLVVEVLICTQTSLELVVAITKIWKSSLWSKGLSNYRTWLKLTKMTNREEEKARIHNSRIPIKVLVLTFSNYNLSQIESPLSN